MKFKPTFNKLKAQATEIEYSHGAFGEPENYRKVNVEKFYESIVKECIMLIKERESPHFYVDDLVLDISEYFGVENEI